MTDSLPIDPDSAAVLAAHGLEFDLVDPADTAAVRAWLLADTRGFLDAVPSDEALAALAAEIEGDRTSGVRDQSGAAPEIPVATVRSWEMGLTVPGGAALPAWAISSVTVSPTHRRRGIARALLTAELRTAAALGLPMAMLTVSEATIYGRYGFGPAAGQAHYEIDTARARWTGPTASGRVQFVEPATLVTDGPPVFERARTPGDVDRRPAWWQEALRLTAATPIEEKRALRAVRYDDAEGVPQGFALYTIVLHNDTYPARLELVDLVAATADAAAGLWRFLLEMDLVATIGAPLRPVSEPLSWQVADRRAVRKTQESDHLWLRILDVPAVFAARRYGAPGTFVLTVTDDLGFIGGAYLLRVAADGTGHARPLADAPQGPGTDAPAGETPPVDAVPAGTACLALTAADLAALYLGGGSAVDLARAGRLTEQSPGAAARLDAALHSPHTPFLSTWF